MKPNLQTLACFYDHLIEQLQVEFEWLRFTRKDWTVDQDTGVISNYAIDIIDPLRDTAEFHDSTRLGVLTMFHENLCFDDYNMPYNPERYDHEVPLSDPEYLIKVFDIVKTIYHDSLI